VVERPDEIVYIGYTGGLGGEAAQMFELAAGVAARGRTASVFVPDLPGMSSFVEIYGGRPGLRVVTTPLIRFGGATQDPRRVLALLRPHRTAAILHIHTGDICIPRMTLLMLEALRPRNLFGTIHAALPEMTPGSARARYWASAVARRFRRIFCPSHQGRHTQTLYRVPEDKLVTIHNGVYVERYAHGNAAVARRRLGLEDEVPLVVTTSRLHPQKRPLDALEAFRRVVVGRGTVGESPRPHLVFVGEGPLEADLRARTEQMGLNGWVHFVGRQENIPDWLAAATVWLFPSEAEHASLSLIEALAAGCAVAANLCPGNDEVLIPGENAFTANVGDVDTLAAALARLLGDPILRERLGTAGRATASRFTQDVMVERYLACYDEALTESVRSAAGARHMRGTV